MNGSGPKGSLSKERECTDKGQGSSFCQRVERPHSRITADSSIRPDLVISKVGPEGTVRVRSSSAATPRINRERVFGMADIRGIAEEAARSQASDSCGSNCGEQFHLSTP